MGANHTPGPWAETHEPDGYTIWQTPRECGVYPQAIARIVGQRREVGHERANARLIALAPYLYAIADELTAEADAGHHAETTAVVWARHALAMLSEDPPCIHCGAPESGHDAGCAALEG